MKSEAWDGTGVELVKQPSKPGQRLYPARCKVCGGKGRIKTKDKD